MDKSTWLKGIQVKDIEAYKQFSKDFGYYIEFFENLSGLISNSGRVISFITNKEIYYLDTGLIDSSVQTLRSIQLCCSIGSFSDANTLIRKFRDDLLLYIFILDTINRRKPFHEDDCNSIDLNDYEKFAESFMNVRRNNILTKDEQAVSAWFGNLISVLPNRIRLKLSFENYMKVLGQNEDINKILVEYNLGNYWEKLRLRLNDVVHNNGRQFTNQNTVTGSERNVSIHLKNINIRTTYISSFFLVLLLMIDSSLISSTDYTDHLECDLEPPEGCQYFIAGFVQIFIDKEVSKLHPELKQYLKDNNNGGMKIR